MQPDNFLDMHLTGMSLDLAKWTIEVIPGARVRVMRIDKTNYIGTCDLDVNRFNLEVDNNIVTKVTRG